MSSDDEAQVERLLRQLDLDRLQSTYWRERWANDGGTDGAIEAWLRSLLDWLEPPAYALPPLERTERRHDGARRMSAETGDCPCWTCEEERREARFAVDDNWIAYISRRMIVCPNCGNKRCPHGTHHDNACTGSNEPNQPGSRYNFAADFSVGGTQ